MYRQPLYGNTTIAAALPHMAIPGGALPLQPRPLSIYKSNSDSSLVTVTERSNYHMSNRQRNLGINIRVTPQEKKKIERNAKKCRLTVSEYLRQLAMNKEPKALPPEEVVQSLMRLRTVISAFEKAAENASTDNGRNYYRKYADHIRQIMVETLQMITRSVAESEIKYDGNN